MKYVFISYVKEDFEQVNLIKALLEKAGVKVWLDRSSLEPGQKWKTAIKKAIKDGAFFIACFSDNYYQKDPTYMNEELTTAIEELRLKPYEKSWLIPVRLSDCMIPERPIGAGEYFSDLQRVDLFGDFVGGMQKLVQLVVPIVSPREYVFYTFKRAINYHIHNKIKYFEKVGVHRFKEVEDRWLSLLEDKVIDIMFRSFFELHERARVSNKHEFDRIVEPSEDGRVILLSVVPNQNVISFIKSLPTAVSELEHNYSNFIIEKRREFRLFSSWWNRDFVHIIYFQGKEDLLFDILYIINQNLNFLILMNLMKKSGFPNKQGGKSAIGYATMYPTCLMSSIEVSSMAHFIFMEEVDQIESLVRDKRKL